MERGSLGRVMEGRGFERVLGGDLGKRRDRGSLGS